MKQGRYFTGMLAILLLLAACQDEPVIPAEIELDLKSQTLVEADNAMGIDMFQRINETEEGNFAVSPLSVSLALAMTYNGAKEETKAAMEEAMHLSGLTTEEINRSYQSLVKALLGADPKVTIEIAQSIWCRQGINVLNDFVQVNKTYYDAEVKNLDFSQPDALDIMNGWIEDKTHGKICDMVKEIKPTHVMFLINAIYFNGEWKTKFESKDTYKSIFMKENGSTIDVSMMKKTDSVNYLANDLFSAIELPYGRGNYNMVILLPEYGKTCKEIVTVITPAKWKQWMAGFSMTPEVNIHIPKFKSEFEIKLNEILSAMGMEIAFGDRANFSGIIPDLDIYIDYVQHNTFIDVNEKGTEAAAATVVAMDYKMAGISFVADRPFLYAITEKETGAILFIGKMAEPAYD